MGRIPTAWGAAVLLAACSGCTIGREVGPGSMETVPFPVLVGPALKIGGGPLALDHEVGKVEGRAKNSYGAGPAPGGGSIASPPYESDSLARYLVSGGSKVRGCVARVMEIEAINEFHISFIGAGDVQLRVRCVLWARGPTEDYLP